MACVGHENEMNGSSDHMRDAGSRSSRSPAPPPITSTSTSTSKRAVRPPPARPTAAAPAVRTFFDPWNSSSTGHQRAENRLSGSTSWRYSRNLKLSEQYKGGLQGGSKRVFDTVGAGSKDFGKDGRKENGGWEKGASGLRTGGQQSLAEIWGASKPSKDNSEQKEIDSMQSRMSPPASAPTPRDDAFLDNDGSDVESQLEHNIAGRPAEKQIFAGLCFYTNGSTAPLVSDHKLKHMLAAHGATHSIALGRRSVTHVILGTSSRHGGAGGGLAATKIQKEIARTGAKAVKFITVEWVLESIKAQCRLSESRFSPLSLAPKTQKSVLSALGSKSKAATNKDQG